MGVVTELKKVNGEVLRIIDGEYVIGANSGCFSSPKPCRKIINGEYLVEGECGDECEKRCSYRIEYKNNGYYICFIDNLPEGAVKKTKTDTVFFYDLPFQISNAPCDTHTYPISLQFLPVDYYEDEEYIYFEKGWVACDVCKNGGRMLCIDKLREELNCYKKYLRFPKDKAIKLANQPC